MRNHALTVTAFLAGVNLGAYATWDSHPPWALSFALLFLWINLRVAIDRSRS